MAIPNSAKHIVQQFLDQYGLGSLINWAWSTYKQAGGNQVGIEAISADLPNQPAFKARFPAYETLAKEGRAMSVQDMLNYETTARQIFQAAGIPGDFYTTPKELASFMLGNVSTAELETRVKDAQQAMISSPQDVRDQLNGLYGVDHGHLTAFFLDPNVAEPLIAQRFTAAQIAAESGRAGVGQLSRGQAEGLAQLGVNDATAQQGFQKLGLEQGLFEQQVSGEQSVGLDQELAAQFGGEGSVSAQLEFERRRQARLASFQEGTGFQTGSTGVGGLAQPKGA